MTAIAYYSIDLKKKKVCAITNHEGSWAQNIVEVSTALNPSLSVRYRKICSFNITEPEDYLYFYALDFNRLRTVSHLRVSSNDIKLLIKDVTLNIKSSKVCKCLLTNSMSHLLNQCSEVF